MLLIQIYKLHKENSWILNIHIILTCGVVILFVELLFVSTWVELFNLLLLISWFFCLTICSADLSSSKVTPCVERLVSLTRLACAFLWVSDSSSLTGGTNDLKKYLYQYNYWKYIIQY